MPLLRAMLRARASVAGGVGGRFRILKSGWKAVKCTGTSGSSSPATHRVIALISASESVTPDDRVVVGESDAAAAQEPLRRLLRKCVCGREPATELVVKISSCGDADPVREQRIEFGSRLQPTGR